MSTARQKLLHCIISLCFLLFIFGNVLATNHSSFKNYGNIQATTEKIKYGSIPVIVLRGSHQQMGIQYGQVMQDELQQSLNILKDWYITQHGISYEKLLAKANNLYERFPLSFQLYIQGVSKGSNLSLDDIKILNAMETMGSITSDGVGYCSFLAVPHTETETNSILIGRNYDFPPPFDKIAQYLSVTILKEDNAESTAIISLPGQIYCPSCVNEDGLFMELNNGTPSGGKFVDINRQSLLVNMLQIMQNSKNLQQMEKQLNATQSDYSLIVNTADQKQVKSYEFSSTLGMHTMFPSPDVNFVSTNFYLSDTWKDIPIPTDATTWMGVTRRNNLLNLASVGKFDIKRFEALMDKNIKDGGAVWDLTIYQIIFDPSTLSLYLKINNHSSDWIEIPLGKIFDPKIRTSQA